MKRKISACEQLIGDGTRKFRKGCGECARCVSLSQPSKVIIGFAAFSVVKEMISVWFLGS